MYLYASPLTALTRTGINFYIIPSQLQKFTSFMILSEQAFLPYESITNN
jgi:hypothetical protein